MQFIKGLGMSGGNTQNPHHRLVARERKTGNLLQTTFHDRRVQLMRVVGWEHENSGMPVPGNPADHAFTK